jgi:hypothetical protein
MLIYFNIVLIGYEIAFTWFDYSTGGWDMHYIRL